MKNRETGSGIAESLNNVEKLIIILSAENSVQATFLDDSRIKKAVSFLKGVCKSTNAC